MDLDGRQEQAQVMGRSPVVDLGVREVFGIGVGVDLVCQALRWQICLADIWGWAWGPVWQMLGCGWSQEWVLSLGSHRWWMGGLMAQGAALGCE